MKKITSISGDIIRFRLRGDTHFIINGEGVVANDADAEVVAERLGRQVRIEDTNEVPAAPAAPEVTPEETPAADTQEPGLSEEAPQAE